MTVSLIDQSATTVVTTLGSSAILSLLVIGLIIYALCKFIESNRGKFNPYLHMPHPPTIEHDPRGSLPPARGYVEWTAEKDKEKDSVPWDR